MKNKYTNKQWTVLFVYSVINFFSASSISLQGPFYPMIAKEKGLNAKHYGFVLGVFNFGQFIMNPLTGILIGKFGAIKISILGLSFIGITNILFGFINKLNGKYLFFGLSILIRISESVGYSMARNSGIAIISCEFFENIEMAFAFSQTFFSTGQSLGPVLGGALFELGGFRLPFLFVGGIFLCLACVVLLLPKDYPNQEAKLTKDIFRLFQSTLIILGILTVFGVLLNIGFIIAILEPHLEILNLSPVQVGLMFLCHAIAIGFSNMTWGKICEKYDNPTLIVSISSILIILGFLLLGPAPYVFLEMSIYTSIFGLLFLGLGGGGGQVAGFSCLNKGAKLAGFPQNIQTSGIVSAIFTSSIALGSFTGACLGGYLYETFGFPWGSHFFISYQIILFIILVIYMRFINFSSKSEKQKENILSSNNDEQSYNSIN